MPIDDRKIVVSNFSGKGYGDNPKYIVEKLLKKNDALRIIWILRNIDDKETLPTGMEYCLEKSFMAVYHLRTAKVWIDNCRKSYRFKRSNQFYLQTWHGFALKRIEKDVVGSLSKGYIRNAIRDSRHIDLIVSCSRFMTQIYKNSFWYDGEILEIGAPRNDVIIKSDKYIKNKVIDFFDIAEEKGIVLYAPTFRVDKSLEYYSLDYDQVKKACEQKFKKNFTILVRLHPSMSDINLNVNYDGCNIINANKYPDMQELLCATDIVITDYSSLMFDFALSKKPCFLFATDIERYKNDRNFYFDLIQLPFMVAETNELLVENILSFDESIYKGQLCEFFRNVGMIMDGQASKSVTEVILGIMQSPKC